MSTWSGPNVVQASAVVRRAARTRDAAGSTRGRTTCDVSKSGSALEEVAVVRRVAREPAAEPRAGSQTRGWRRSRGPGRGRRPGRRCRPSVPSAGFTSRWSTTPNPSSEVHGKIGSRCTSVTASRTWSRSTAASVCSGVSPCAAERVAVGDQVRRCPRRASPRSARAPERPALRHRRAPRRTSSAVELLEQESRRRSAAARRQRRPARPAPVRRRRRPGRRAWRVLRPSSSRRVVSRPQSSSSVTRSENDRRPPNGRTVSAHSSRSAYVGRATRQSGSLAQNRPCCQARATSDIRPRRPCEPSSPPSWKVSGETRIASTRPTLGRIGAPQPRR